MNYSNYRFTLDIQSNLSQVSLPVKLNDTGRRFLIGLTDGGNPYPISEGSMAKFTYKKTEPNSEGIYEAGMYDCILEDNYSTIRFDLTSAVTSVAGVVDCEIRLYGPNGRLLTSPRFILVVDERVIYDDDIPLSEQQASTIDAIILTEASRVEEESKRVSAEKARAEAETQRATAFSAAETQRATAFSVAETQRATAFSTAETERETAFQEAEASRNESVYSAVRNATSAANVAEAKGNNAYAAGERATQATENILNMANNGDFDGEDGEDGATPYIGANENWWIDGVDTGKPSRGATGATGKTGAKIVTTSFKGQDEFGGYVYEQIFDDGSTSTFTAPRGLQGNPGKDADSNMMYPIGFPFVSNDPTTPNQRGILGTWEAIPEGHTIIGAGSTYPANSTGGEATVTLTTDQMPYHTHQEMLSNGNWNYNAVYNQGGTVTTYDGAAISNLSVSNEGAYAYVGYSGNNQPHNNMAPYIAKYMWVRIA